ncbi:IreB family regulatory phosphoprotein [Tepidibacter aestuarii]|uniref:IreB family regulatory phosphoprotein n=1 Tax=Tepidibacter aestuarii TaxID=2925782 RepID=UPI00273A6866|nr:IreB family regulatory phosphoprotein [Tepidibacter aestuarii]
MMENMDYTMKFEAPKEENLSVDEIIESVYAALVEKGYNPINQLIGYFLSGDPTYITSHNNARSLIKKYERDEILEEILKKYLEGK